MKYQIRKTTKVSLKLATEAVELNPEDFKNLSVPFTGNTDKEFLEYIWTLRHDIPSDLPDELADVLDDLFDGPMHEIYNSADDREDSVLELGEVNSNFTKQGGFMIHHTTAEF